MLQIETSMYTCLQISSLSIFEKTKLSCAFLGDESTSEQSDDTKQLILFSFLPDSSDRHEDVKVRIQPPPERSADTAMPSDARVSRELSLVSC